MLAALAPWSRAGGLGRVTRLLLRGGTIHDYGRGDDAPRPTGRPLLSPDTRRSRTAGFTLLELLVVLAILGLLVGLVGPAVLRQLGGAQNSVARQSIERIAGILDLYRLDVGGYPTTEQGLQALLTAPSGVPGWNGPYVRGGQLPLDPCNRPYLYRNPGSRSGRDFDLCSRGPEGRAGDAMQSGMICNP